MPWTTKQQQVIEQRGKNILVSAAAGSGKTATLVERIFQKVTDAEHPMNIQDFLIVTFTRAAAAQMKEKLLRKLEEALSKEPENEHLAKQNLLVHSADITTIDSFCFNIVKDHFDALSLDPAIQIGDFGMLEMLKYDVMTEVFEEQYAKIGKEGNPEFELLLDVFCEGKKEDGLRELLDMIYLQMSSVPDPDRFLQEARAALMIEDMDALNDAPWIKEMMKQVRNRANAGKKTAEFCVQICQRADGPNQYETQFVSDVEKLDRLANAKTYDEMRAVIEEKWATLSRKKSECDVNLANQCKELRSRYKDDLSKLDCFKQSASDILEDLAVMRAYLLALLDLEEVFMNRFFEAKKARKMLEFSDISHMAYKLVCAGYDEEGIAIPTEIGMEIANQYQEIYIDEYQDSNYIQEDILTAISGYSSGENHLFMVGDVKQSIYRFRMARPEIFMEKYRRYPKEVLEEERNLTIELNHNFRSREVVLRCINYFFYQLMGEDLGGIVYDEGQALVPGKEFAKPKELEVASQVEFLCVDTEDTGALPKDTINSLNKDEVEAMMIANRIHELVNPQSKLCVVDEETEEYRKPKYRDIVILARSVKGYGEILYNTLRAQGIPVYLERSQGYFQAVEIQVILSLLAVLDNSGQDIPLCAVLLSPIGKMDESELALIQAYVRAHATTRLTLYEACEYYELEHENEALGKKIRDFLDLVETLKEEKQSLSVSKLIWKILTMTGYYDYVSAMPAGEIRRANIDMLLEKAVQFENGYYKGLFHFLRYVEKLKQMDSDEGEASVLSEDADVVRIMSIHKSKGLEFPIVFVAGMGRKFNRQELSNNVILHPDYYLTSMAMHTKGRYKRNTAIRSIFASLEQEASMAESLRVLYVAMTRAKELLILSSSVKNMPEQLEKLSYLAENEEKLLPYDVRANADSYLKQLLACMIRYERLAAEYSVEDSIAFSVKSAEEVLHAGIERDLQSGYEHSKWKAEAAQVEADAYYEQLKTSFSYLYPHQAMTQIGGKLSTSDIKKMKAYDGQEYDTNQELSEHVEKKEKGEEKTAGIPPSQKGTIIHKFMELLPFEEVEGIDNLKDYLLQYKNRLVEQGVWTKEEAAVIYVDRIAAMLQSPLGGRMIAAACRNELF
ncbi:MAG: helicase-exonuclease AddAB subunit AddA, partial [Wujia sp.]